MILEWTSGAFAQFEHRQEGEGGAWNYSVAFTAPAAATVYAGNRRRGSVHRYEVRLSSWVFFLLALAACSGPGRPLEYTEDPPAPVDSAAALRESLQRALDSLERERCKPPTCYPDPRPPSPP